ncbi:MAG: hypothetical protein O7E51_13285 [Acidobacteria bacterium]|nr:hypothetical protein [Acidobacteriota bacterium]
MKNGAEPATKADLKEGLDGLRAELLQAIHDMETRILRAFYAYTEATQKHLADLDRSDGSMRDRMGTLEVRITEIEKRINFPPTPTS